MAKRSTQAAETAVVTLPAPLARELADTRKVFNNLRDSYDVVRVRIKDKCKPIMSLFRKIRRWREDNALDFTLRQFAVLLDSTVPASGNEYRRNPTWIALQYIQQTHTRLVKEEYSAKLKEAAARGDEKATKALEAQAIADGVVKPEADGGAKRGDREVQITATFLMLLTPASREVFWMALKANGITSTGKTFKMFQNRVNEAVKNSAILIEAPKQITITANDIKHPATESEAAPAGGVMDTLKRTARSVRSTAALKRTRAA